MRYTLLFLLIFMSTCMADTIREVNSCELKQGEEIHLITLNNIDGDTLYLKFRNILTGAFLESWEENYLTVGDIVLSMCVNNSLIFAINYGSPYLKGCIVTGWNESDNKPENFCFAERNTPETVWFGQKNILIIIRNQMDVGSWYGKYIIYDNSKKSGERASSSDVLPSTHGYKIFQVK